MADSPLPPAVLDRLKRIVTVLTGLSWLGILPARVAIGLLFASTGWGKVGNLEGVTRYFTSLGIPMPGINAVVASFTELIGGSLLVVGLGSRLAAAPLCVTMVVALITAKREKIHGLIDLVGQDEFTYLTLLFLLIFVGPGKASLDELLARKFVPRE